MNNSRFAKQEASSLRDPWMWIPLLFSATYFAPLLFNPAYQSLNYLVPAASIYLLFLFLYISAWPMNSSVLELKLSCLALLLIVGSFYNIAVVSLIGFFSYLVALHYRLRVACACSFFLAVSICASVQFSGPQWTIAIPPMVLMLGMLCVGHWQQREYELECSEREANASIARLSAEVERERIARDLHDSVGHCLATIALKAELLEKLSEQHVAQDLQKQALELAELSRSALKEIRESIIAVRCDDLYAVVHGLEVQLSEHGFACDIQLQKLSISPDLEAHLIMILKEACANIMQHSDGDFMSLGLAQDEEFLALTVHDNGSLAVSNLGSGLSGMRARCEQMRGDFELTYHSGVLLRMDFPLHIAQHFST